MRERLPIEDVLPQLADSLRHGTAAVLVAPPGAGKTTRVAPALLREPWCDGQVIVTSPRRVAARAAAERMAQELGEPVGRTVGYATRLETRTSPRTRILVVTEAILVRRIIDDPELAGVSAVLFDEAHERRLDGDLGLALALDSADALRPDLRIVIMSATIDGARFAGLLGPDAPVVRSEGRAHPLAIRWLSGPPGERMEDGVVRGLVAAWRETEGDMLAFLPGIAEIERAQRMVEARLPDAAVLPLHGQLEPAAQRVALRRHPGGRRIVLATSIAETSLTLDGVSVVVDGGWARRARFDRASGATRLVTERASQAAAAQRAGRAARQGPGVAYRLWEEAGHAGRPPFDPPDIAIADLAPLLLTLSEWGVADPAALRWLDPPPQPSLAAARTALRTLGAMDDAGRITPRGRRMAKLPLDPRDAAMLLFAARHGAARQAAALALLLQERGLGGMDVDLFARLQRWERQEAPAARARRALAENWARLADALQAREAQETPPLAVLLAAGRPEFIARRRDGSGEHWLSAGGRGYRLDPADPLTRNEFLVIGDAQGSAAGARITAALPLAEADVLSWCADRIQTEEVVQWSGDRIDARAERRMGAIKLHSANMPAPDPDRVADQLVARALESIDAILPSQLVARGRLAGIAALAPNALRASLPVWLRPLLHGRRDLNLASDSVERALLETLTWDDKRRLESAAPAHFESPAGSRHPVDYTGPDAPSVEVRVQAMFGMDRHPLVGGTPLLLKLTSPAGRPLQATRDIPGFWRGSWRDVRKEMKGRYPRHRWPEEPWREEPGVQTKNAFAARRS